MTGALSRRQALAWRLALPLTVAVAWVVLSRLMTSPTARMMLPPPEAVYESAHRLLTTGQDVFGVPALLAHVGESLKRMALGYGAAVAVGVPLGIVVGYFRVAETNLDFVIQALRPISPVAWIPIALTWFGIGMTTVAFIVFYGAFFPIVINTIGGVKGVSRTYVRAALVCGCGAGRILRRVILPGALPMILTGMRIGLGVGWMSIIAAELVGTQSGLGYMISEARFHLDVESIVVGMLAIGLLGLLSDRCLRWLHARLVPWHQKV
jgi:NitT/TauT family transport system permease protein/taurine transport system permease protein